MLLQDNAFIAKNILDMNYRWHTFNLQHCIIIVMKLDYANGRRPKLTNHKVSYNGTSANLTHQQHLRPSNQGIRGGAGLPPGP